MPVDLDRIIDYQLYLATQRCIAPYLQGRKDSNEAAGAGTDTGTGTGSRSAATDRSPVAHTGSERRSSVGSLSNSWDVSFGRGDGGGAPATRGPIGPSSSRRSHSSDDSESFFSVSVGDLEAPVVSAGSSGGSGGDGTGTEPDSIATVTREVLPTDDFITALGYLGLTDTATSGAVFQPHPKTQAQTQSESQEQSEPEPQAQPESQGKEQPQSPQPSPPPSDIAVEEMASPSQESQTPSPSIPSTPLDPLPLSRVTSITLLVEDLAGTTRFYEQVFSTPPIHEDKASAVFHFNGGALLVTFYVSYDARANRLLGERVHVGRARDVGRRFQLSVAVDDVDEEYARLRKLDEEWKDEGKDEEEALGLGRRLRVEGLSEPCTRPWGMRTVTFQDPSGHCWEFAQDLWWD